MKLYQNKGWVYQKYHIEKLAVSEIIKLCGLSTPGSLLYWMDKFNISRRDRRNAWKVKPFKYHDRKWLYQKYVIEKLGAPEIAKLCKCSDSVIYTWLEKFYVPRRNRVDAHAALRGKQITKEWLQKKYQEEKLSCPQIAELLNCSSGVIQRRLKYFNIPIRSMSETMMGRTISQETRKKKSEIQRKVMSSKRLRKLNSDAMKQRWADPEFRKVMSAKMRRQWRDPDYRARVIPKMCSISSPTVPERIFDELTPNSVHYVGDGTWWRKLPNGKYKNPDFKVMGQDKVIEIFGNYWHRKGTLYDNPQKLIDLYRQVEIDCLVFWESEIHDKPDIVLERTINFL